MLDSEHCCTKLWLGCCAQSICLHSVSAFKYMPLVLFLHMPANWVIRTGRPHVNLLIMSPTVLDTNDLIWMVTSVEHDYQVGHFIVLFVLKKKQINAHLSKISYYCRHLGPGWEIVPLVQVNNECSSPRVTRGQGSCTCRILFVGPIYYLLALKLQTPKAILEPTFSSVTKAEFYDTIIL